jgi:serine/threonine protein kinase/Flp pilus assembly protein TadD
VNTSRARIETLFHEALQLAPEEREQFLLKACGADHRLRIDLASLLANYESSGSTFEQPLIDPQFLLRLGSSLIEPGDLLAGRFRIVRALASGGMGNVYEADDEQLGDRIALKTIRTEVAANPRMLARFKKEIQLAKRISHPNVCRIHDLGMEERSEGTIAFFTMELLTGETLTRCLERNRLTLAETGRIAAQIADGLDAAHRAGVIHRDLKTSNIILAQENSQLRVVITDFGIAHAAEPLPGSGALTLTGEIIGTPDYMAPEQLRGEEITPATDIYAFGLILFEMITGERPFAGETPLAAAVKRLDNPPPSARFFVRDLPQAWETTILRCLEPDPGKRFQSALDVVRSANKKHGWTAQLARKQIVQKAFGFPIKRLLIFLIAALLSTAALIFIAQRRHSGTQPVSRSRATTSPAGPAAAKIHYERGLYFWNLRTQDGFLKAIDEYKKATEADPQYALPYSGLAWVYAMQSGFKAPTQVFPEAKKYAEKAIRLDSKLAAAHAALAFIRFYYDWDWKNAEDEYLAAVTLDPSYASAHSNYAILLAVTGRFRDAEKQAKLAEQADPVSAAVGTGLGRVYFWSGNYEQAIRQFESVLSMHPQFLEAHLSLASALEAKGDYPAAVRQISYVLSDSLHSSALADLGYLYARMNDRQLARSMLSKIENLRADKGRYISPCYPAVVHAALGESDEAFNLLNQGLRERTFEMVYLNINREYSSLRHDHRWARLVRSVGLPK